VADFRRLSPDLDADAPLNPDQTPLVPVPDPEFAPLLAARCAAEVLVSEPHRDERMRLIQRLIPIAAANPTTLDTVLARLLLAAHPVPVPILDRLTEIAEASTPKQYGKREGAMIHGPMIGARADVLGNGRVSVDVDVNTVGQGGVITGPVLGNLG
jgi:hypothetical protein